MVGQWSKERADRGAAQQVVKLSGWEGGDWQDEIFQSKTAVDSVVIIVLFPRDAV